MEENNIKNVENNKFNFSKNKSNFSEKSKTGFGKSVLIPFCSGVIGAALVVGACFGIPTIRDNIVGSSSTTKTTTTQAVGTRKFSFTIKLF